MQQLTKPKIIKQEYFFSSKITIQELATTLEVGDLVFICMGIILHRIARDTNSWTNHIGIVIETDGKNPVIAESVIPFSKIGSFSRFAARSKKGRIAVLRLNTPLTSEQRLSIKNAAEQRLGVLYDIGFDLYSKGQFCSRFAREVMHEATGVSIGEVQNFTTLFAQNPGAKLLFWRLWFFGRIPWDRETVSPVSMLIDEKLHSVFDGYGTEGNTHA